ncbi:MAG: hypothetical protein AAGB34_02735 [Planctomycetota bacterium]
MPLSFSTTVRQLLALASLVDSEHEIEAAEWQQTSGLGWADANIVGIVSHPQPVDVAFRALVASLPARHLMVLSKLLQDEHRELGPSHDDATASAPVDVEILTKEILHELRARGPFAQALTNSGTAELDALPQRLAA